MEVMVWCELPTLGPVQDEPTDPSIIRLIPLEVSAPDKDSDTNRLSCSDSQTDVSKEVKPRPTRNSATKARERLAWWADILSAPPEDVTDNNGH